jgi:hypothetical protein
MTFHDPLVAACLFEPELLVSIQLVKVTSSGGYIVQELVGHCIACNKGILCIDGFLNGVVLEDKSLICFACLDNDQTTYQIKER